MAEDPLIAQKSPYVVELVEGKQYWWCRCGRSKRQPFCDSSHKGTGLEPLAFMATATGPASLCGCKQSDDQPFCDGSHNML
jgi:CDGSH-type Zn-finger protein